MNPGRASLVPQPACSVDSIIGALRQHWAAQCTRYAAAHSVLQRDFGRFAMDRHDDSELTRDLDTTTADHETHASTAAPPWARYRRRHWPDQRTDWRRRRRRRGAIVGVAAERLMHGDDDADHDHVDTSTTTSSDVSATDMAGRDIAATDVTAASSTASLTDDGSSANREDDTER
jgi:hypothetical protein